MMRHGEAMRVRPAPPPKKYHIYIYFFSALSQQSHPGPIIFYLDCHSNLKMIFQPKTSQWIPVTLKNKNSGFLLFLPIWLYLFCLMLPLFLCLVLIFLEMPSSFLPEVYSCSSPVSLGCSLSFLIEVLMEVST